MLLAYQETCKVYVDKYMRGSSLHICLVCMFSDFSIILSVYQYSQMMGSQYLLRSFLKNTFVCGVCVCKKAGESEFFPSILCVPEFKLKL